MSKRTRSLALIFLAFSMIGQGCSGSGASSPFALESGTPTPPDTPTPSSTPEAPSLHEEEATPIATQAPTCIQLDAELRSQMDAIQDQVVTLRGLRPTGSVDRTLLTPDELRQRVIDDFLADYTDQEAQDEARVYSL